MESTWSGILLLPLVLVGSYPTGPPAYDTVCNNLMPSSLSPHHLQVGNGSYDINTNVTLSDSTPGYFKYKSGEKYSVTVATTEEDVSFKGFLIQAWDPIETRIGEFTITNPLAQKLLDCSTVTQTIPAAATVCHSAINENKTQTVIWTAPPSATGSGLVDFRFTLVRSFTEYFGPLSAASPDGFIVPTNRSTLPETVAPLDRDPESYRIKARNPSRCKSFECAVFVGIDTNQGDEDYLDIYLTGSAKAWVAVGFSETPDMYNASVVGCNFNPNSEMLEALDTLNPTGRRDNVLVYPQRNFLYNGSYSDGRITCTISRKIVFDDDEGELFSSTIEEVSFNNLNRSFYLLYGVGHERAAQSLTPHAYGFIGTPHVSKGKVNLASGASNFAADTVRPALTRLHGILMWIAWPVLACTGIFFALWMRPVLPNGEWFQVHRALMLSSLVVAVMGIVAIFASQYRSVPTKGIVNFKDSGTALLHLVLGLVVMAIVFINPLVALCRCKPDSSRRWIFNIIHGFGLGLLAQTLAIVNMGMGFAMFDKTISSRFGSDYESFWLYVIFVIVFSLMNIGLAVIINVFKGSLSCITKKSGSEKAGLLQSDKIKNEETSLKPQTQQSSFLWGVLIGYLIFIGILTVCVIVLLSL